MMESIWVQLSLLYFLLAHIVVIMLMFWPRIILPKFMRSWLIFNNFISRLKGVYVTREQNQEFWKRFEESQNRTINTNITENEEFPTKTWKMKFEIVKDRILTYLKVVAVIWWIYLFIIIAATILTTIDRTLEDQL